jgi:hypothetical protein
MAIRYTVVATPQLTKARFLTLGRPPHKREITPSPRRPPDHFIFRNAADARWVIPVPAHLPGKPRQPSA